MAPNYSFDNMTAEDIWRELYECDDMRKDLKRKTAGRNFTSQEQEELDAMNEWAEQAFAEIMRRRGPNPTQEKMDS
jgi:hypothetical protein